MSQTASARCAACARTEDDAVRVVSSGGLPLCADCIKRFEAALRARLDDESRRRGEVSHSAMAEELALNLMDALEASRGGEPEEAPELPPRQALPPEPAPAEEEPEPQAAPPIRVVAVIPSRYGSTRLPAKPLARIAGKPLVQHVWERCVKSGAFAEVLVATDDPRIADVVQSFGGTAVMTPEYLKSGTDRVAEVAKQRPELTHFVNVQGDEPLVHEEMLQSLAGAFQDPEVEMATLVRPLDEHERPNPNVVKVVLTREGDALYFSRADIPFERNPGEGFPHRYAHLGLYAYTRRALLRLAALPVSPLEDTEKLEQLRALECGLRIRCLMTLHRTIAVDTAEDVLAVEQALATAASSGT